jgi:HSP20 family protein
MVEAAVKVPVKSDEGTPQGTSTPQAWQPFETLRREVDRLFDDFGRDFWRSPFRRPMFDLDPLWRRELSWAAAPAVDIVEKEKAFEITAELPGLDEKNIDVKVANDGLTIKAEKKEEIEEKKKDYYLQERRYGSFRRSFHCLILSMRTRSKQASRRVCSP